MYMCQKGGGVGHCAVRVHGNNGNMAATLETDMEVEQENNGPEHDLDEDKVQFNDLYGDSNEHDSDVDDEDSDGGEAEVNDNLDIEEYEDELEDY